MTITKQKQMYWLDMYKNFSAFASLSPREVFIVEKAVYEKKGWTAIQKDLVESKLFGVISVHRVSQIHSKVLRKLEHHRKVFETGSSLVDACILPVTKFFHDLQVKKLDSVDKENNQRVDSSQKSLQEFKDTDLSNMNEFEQRELLENLFKTNGARIAPRKIKAAMEFREDYEQHQLCYDLARQYMGPNILWSHPIKKLAEVPVESIYLLQDLFEVKQAAFFFVDKYMESLDLTEIKKLIVLYFGNNPVKSVSTMSVRNALLKKYNITFN